VSRQYDVYYGWQLSQAADDAPAGVRRSPSRTPGRLRRHRRWYLGVDKYGTVRTFRVRSVHRRRARHGDVAEEPEFHLPRRVMFFQRWISAMPPSSSSSSSSNFPVGRVSVVPPGWTSPLPTEATTSRPDMDRRRRRRQRRRRRCSRLLSECRERRRKRRQDRRRRTSTTHAASSV